MELNHHKGLFNHPQIDKIKELRKEYKHFPYLYQYDDKEEERYLRCYENLGDKLDVISVINKRNKVVAIAFRCPVSKEIEITKELYDFDISLEKAYYFGDIIVKKDYWGKGIAQMIYDYCISYAKIKGYKKIYTLVVNRDNDKRRPNIFKKSDLWERNGFLKTGLSTTYSWNTFQLDGSVKEELNKMDLYEKTLII